MYDEAGVGRGEHTVGCRGTGWHLLPMALWHRTTADRGLSELSLYPQSLRGLARSGGPPSQHTALCLVVWAGEGASC